jgi:glucan biosynthesis protein
LEKDLIRICKEIGYKKFQKIPWYEDTKYGNSLYNNFDENFFLTLEKNLDNKKVILVAEENLKKVIKYNKKIYYMNDYNFIKLSYNGRGSSNTILFFPKSCE